VSTQESIYGLEEFSSAVREITEAATKELGSFLCAVRQVFGDEEAGRAADLWIASFETANWIDGPPERTCRQVTVHALAQLVEARTLARVTIDGLVSVQPARFDWSTQ
jgi:hypothetical protein